MKKLFLVLWLFSFKTTFCQTPITDTVNVNTYADAINLLFGSLPPSHYPSGVLLDKASYFPKTAYANGTSNDSSFNMIEWYLMYESVRLSRTNPTPWLGFLQLDSVKNKYIELVDVLPFGILDFNVHKLKDSTFIDGSLITSGYSLTEATTNLNKIYKSTRIFSIAPLNLEINTLTPSFIILPNMIFSNNTNSITVIQTDLDDGSGYRNINTNVNFTATYSSAGYKVINTRIIYDNGDTLYSRSELFINSNLFNDFAKTTSNGYNFTFDVDTDCQNYPTEFSQQCVDNLGGATEALCGVWLGCGNSQIRKPIIIFSGYNPKNGKDLLDNGNPKWWNDAAGPIYSLAGWRGPLFETYNGSFTDFSSGPTKSGDNGSNMLLKLHEEGYDIIICRFNDGIGYLQHNAIVVAATIKEVNKRKRWATNPGASINPYEYGTTNSLMIANHENIVIGYSAGALCSRLGLTLMENKVSDFGIHHTKTWVTVDCENQGSNVPIGIQMFFDFMTKSICVLPADFFNTLMCKKSLDVLINKGVATQNTLYHINHLYGAGGSNWNVNQDTDFNDYFSDLNAVSHSLVPANLKGYPLNCRRIGISQGNANGINNNLDNSIIKLESPADKNHIGFGIFPFRLGEARALSPSNNNAFYCRRGIDVVLFFKSFVIEFNYGKYKKNNYINSHKPYDVSTGSTLTTHLILGDKLLGGPPGTASAFLAGVDKTYSSNQHGFSPTVSGLDIHTPGNNNLPRFPDLSLTPANQGLLRINNYTSINNYSPQNDFGYPHINHPNNHYDITPYDAVYAIGEHDASLYNNNQMHVEDPQPYIADFLVEELAPKTLYLSNRNLWDDADFEARNSVLAGNQDIYKHNSNPNDWYPRLQTSPGDFIVSSDNNPIVTMRSNNGDGNSAITLGAGFSAKNGCVFRAYIYGDTYCLPFAGRTNNSNAQNTTLAAREPRPIISSKQAKSKLLPNQKINVTVYPNPSTGVVHFDFKEDNAYIYTINNVLGTVLKTGSISPSVNEIDLQDLKAGVYFLNISSSNYKQTERIILQ